MVTLDPGHVLHRNGPLDPRRTHEMADQTIFALATSLAIAWLPHTTQADTLNLHSTASDPSDIAGVEESIERSIRSCLDRDKDTGDLHVTWQARDIVQFDGTPSARLAFQNCMRSQGYGRAPGDHGETSWDIE